MQRAEKETAPGAPLGWSATIRKFMLGSSVFTGGAGSRTEASKPTGQVTSKIDSAIQPLLLGRFSLVGSQNSRPTTIRESERKT